MTTTIRASISSKSAEHIIRSVNDRVSRLSREWIDAKGTAQRDAIAAELRELEAIAHFFVAEVARPDRAPGASRMEFRITLLRADQSEVTTSYPFHQQDAAMDHMASYAADGYNFRVEFA